MYTKAGMKRYPLGSLFPKMLFSLYFLVWTRRGKFYFFITTGFDSSIPESMYFHRKREFKKDTANSLEQPQKK